MVPDLTLCFCELTRLVMKNGNFLAHKVYITTKVIKHWYDSKPAEEFEAIIKSVEAIVRFPEYIYENKAAKRGELCFVKTVKGIKYFCSIETTNENDPDDGKQGMNYVVTAFRLRKEKYLKDYKLLWSWKGDIPSS